MNESFPRGERKHRGRKILAVVVGAITLPLVSCAVEAYSDEAIIDSCGGAAVFDRLQPGTPKVEKVETLRHQLQLNIEKLYARTKHAGGEIDEISYEPAKGDSALANSTMRMAITEDGLFEINFPSTNSEYDAIYFEVDKKGKAGDIAQGLLVCFDGEDGLRQTRVLAASQHLLDQTASLDG